MKRFILHTLAILALAAIIILALTWHIASTLSRADFTLPDSVHIITLGPSTTACALDDEYLEGMKNISKHGIYLPQLIPLLPQLLDENKQIDTVYINFGRCPIFLHTKYRNIPEVETRGSINYQLRFYYYDFQNTDWKGYARNPDFYLSLLTPDFWDLVKARKPRNLTDYEFGYTNV
ncbi:MAG: hypothetical protein HUK00_03170, partial [Bacteroidaceae bacterium]|nr:hypothetical protein [Bacteroidaceae bacterium]